MNLYESWFNSFNALSPFGKIAYWRKSISEERDRYNSSPYDGDYAYKSFLWKMWRNQGCRTPSEQDVKGYD